MENGPKLEATGHFRVAKVNGKWWMVDPEGYLFWSHGVVRVTTSTGVTPLDGRKHFFEDLPADDSEFGTFYYTHDALLKPYYTVRNIKETYDFHHRMRIGSTARITSPSLQMSHIGVSAAGD